LTDSGCANVSAENVAIVTFRHSLSRLIGIQFIAVRNRTSKSSEKLILSVSAGGR